MPVRGESRSRQGSDVGLDGVRRGATGWITLKCASMVVQEEWQR